MAFFLFNHPSPVRTTCGLSFAQAFFLFLFLFLPGQIVLSSSAAAEEQATSASTEGPAPIVHITGDVDEKQQDNIRAFLSFLQEQQKRELSPEMYQHFYNKIEQDARTALQPFGYYSPEITVSQQKKNQTTEITIQVKRGQPITISALDIQISGAGEENRAVNRAVSRFPLQPGKVLNHEEYEDGKAALITTAIERGYLKAVYTKSQVAVKKKENSAAVYLYLDTGPRYYFGQITFNADFIDHDLLRRIVNVDEKIPLTPGLMTRIRQALFNTEYFSEVDITYNVDDADPQAVPVQIDLKPNRFHRYGFGLGYGTDTGARGTIEYTNRLINRYGHQLDVRLQPSQRKSSFSAAYTLPIDDPKKDRLSITANYESEEFDNTETQSWSTVVSRDYSAKNGNYSIFLKFLYEDYDTGTESGSAPMLIPGVSGTLFFAKNRITTDRGLRIGATLSGTSDSLISETSFFQAEAHAKGIYSFLDKWRWIGRADIAHTLVDNIRDMPPSLRYYAGGDQSVRGYSYKSIGPRDSSGNVRGGKNLLVWSLELERELFDTWSAAVFYDAGSVMDDFSSMNTSSGAGVGARWNGSFGQVRLDVAKPLEGGDWRIHFSMGADL